MNAKKSFEIKSELSERWREYFQFLGKNNIINSLISFADKQYSTNNIDMCTMINFQGGIRIGTTP